MNSSKKIFLLCFLFSLLLPNVVFGQFGIKVGVVVSGYQPSQNLSSQNGHDYRPFLGYEVEWLQNDAGSPDVGLQFGIFYTINISKYFDTQPELYYSRRGLHFYKTELYSTSYNLNVSYLEMPVLFKYKIPLNWDVAPSFLAGPYFAVKLEANRTLNNGNESNTKNVTGIKNFDYGFVFALSSELEGLSPSPIFEIRFNWGLANTMSQPEEFIKLYENPGTVKLLALSLMTGLKLK